MYKVLFCGFKNEYGKPERGDSFEYINFYQVLNKMEDIEASFFAVDEVMLEHGRDEMNRRLLAQVNETKPDLLFCFLFTEEIKKETIATISTTTATKTFNWFADDHWRFSIYSKNWAPLFTAISTTDSQAPEKYKNLGIKHVIKTQWAANHFLYTPQTASQSSRYEVTFVGQNYGNRGTYIESLKQAGVPVEGFGSGWPAGRVNFERMLEIFSLSKISLNFTESSPINFKEAVKMLAKLVIKKELGSYKFDAHHVLENIGSLSGSRRSQIKGRTFEVPACQGFLLTGEADNIDEYYIPDKEIAVYTDTQDLIEKCRYYLSHEDEREAIAKAGYERTIKDHTYVHRFTEIFKILQSL